MKKIQLIAILFVLSFWGQSYAQGKLNFDFDYARFGYDSVSNYVEFYYSFGQSQLTLYRKDTAHFVGATLHIEITDTVANKVVLNKDWKIENAVRDTSKAGMNKNLIGVVGLVIPRGVFKCVVSGQDAVNKNKTKLIVETIKVEPLIGGNLSLSDIELSSNIRQENADSNSIFYKNTLEVQPNPTMIFGEGVPVLFYYTEIYNMMQDSLKGNLKLHTLLVNSKGYKLNEKVKPITRGSLSRVDVGTLNLTKYPTDTYTLIIDAIDSAGNYGISSSKRFYVYNPSVVDTFKQVAGKTDMLGSEFGVLSSEECDQMFEICKYIASGNETSQYGKLDNVEAKRDFLFQFWKKRDQDPATPENEFKNQYMNRVRLANERYGTINRKGMKTDRGRVLVLYGEPDEIDRYPSDLDKKPYEIWHYNQIEGGVIFVFGDVSGFSDYQLLHSTKRGELRDDNWSRRIVTAE
ncbi:MAG: GWxTD domain-containing protein [Ignavibacteria bacterium]|jgi:GWxTD domain-containing protein|nr:GWxTD domain-containing protein [Ignavibacteria bacterium]MCU7499575.1 GWxTD domain-containing protein [Ignavibacteria bacterium]MCU7513038.1 GWxTD domain-containing protein [Ignavibacteria bacterium]MCU7519276.1 GWxTD domain-containing protein [Ignavibacteria bacterium]